jgi:hypothetical protein
MFLISLSINLLFSLALTSQSPLTNVFLAHQWPFKYGTLNDAFGTANMIQGSLTTFVTDRFGCPNSALSLNGGFTYLPSGNYFTSSQFSITLWILPQGPQGWSRILEFSDGVNLNNIAFSMSTNNGNYIMNAQFLYFTTSITCLSTTSLTMSQWNFVAFTYDGSFIRLYINNAQTASCAFGQTMSTNSQTMNFFGRDSIGSGSSVSHSYFDDIRFYTVRLTQTEISSIMDTDDSTFAASPNNFLTNQWPFTAGSLNDFKGSVNMICKFKLILNS